MRARIFLAVFPVALLAAAPASAHFKLHQPADWLVTDDTGDPAGNDGTQKMNPCGAGTGSGLVTKVHAGAMLHVKLTETVAHGGHYRIALVPRYGIVSSDVPEPQVTLSGGECGTAAIQSPVVPPVLADNLFPHVQLTAVDGQLWETDVQLPTTTGEATLQVLEFMTPHPPQCFYHHCAKLEIVTPETDLGPTGYLVIGPDGGAPGADAGDGSGATTGDGSSGSAAPPASGDSGGCSAAGSATPSLITLSLGLLAFASILRRRRQ